MSLKKALRGGDLKNEFLKPEDVEIGVQYAITINPRIQPEDNMFSQHPNALYEWLLLQYELLQSYEGCEMSMYIEISQTGRYHFHGDLILTDIVKFYTKDVPRIIDLSSSRMTRLEEDIPKSKYTSWTQYCQKQEKFIQPHLREELYSKLYNLTDETYIFLSTDKGVSFKDYLKNLIV